LLFGHCLYRAFDKICIEKPFALAFKWKIPKTEKRPWTEGKEKQAQLKKIERAHFGVG